MKVIPISSDKDLQQRKDLYKITDPYLYTLITNCEKSRHTNKVLKNSYGSYYYKGIAIEKSYNKYNEWYIVIKGHILRFKSKTQCISYIDRYHFKRKNKS